MRFIFIILGFFLFGCEGGGSSSGSETGQKKFTITHGADNDEEVFIYYHNPSSSIEMEFKMPEGQCLIVQGDQFQFVKGIKVGMGGVGNLDLDTTRDVFKVVCGLPLGGIDGEEGVYIETSDRRQMNSDMKSVRSFISTGEWSNFHTNIAVGNLKPCQTNNYVIKDVGFFTDEYILTKTSKMNTSPSCTPIETALKKQTEG